MHDILVLFCNGGEIILKLLFKVHTICPDLGFLWARYLTMISHYDSIANSN